MIQGVGISVVLDGRTIIENETVNCASGKMTALVGPSGSGKTTLLHCLGLLLPISAGQILADGEDVTSFTAVQRRKFWRDRAAFVLQDYGVIDDESVAFNVTLSSRRRRKALADRRLISSLSKTGLADRDDELASHLSGGEKQRLALARAIYRDASVLLIDEPTASLDTPTRHAVIDLFAAFARGGATVIIATHDEEMIAACDAHHRMADRMIGETASNERLEHRS